MLRFCDDFSRQFVVFWARSCDAWKMGRGVEGKAVVFGSLYGGELVTTTSYSELAMEGRRQLQSFHFQARWGNSRHGEAWERYLHSRTRPPVPTSLG